MEKCLIPREKKRRERHFAENCKPARLVDGRERVRTRVRRRMKFAR